MRERTNRRTRKEKEKTKGNKSRRNLQEESMLKEAKVSSKKSEIVIEKVV